jgi:hypothetical protein
LLLNFSNTRIMKKETILFRLLREINERLTRIQEQLAAGSGADTSAPVPHWLTPQETCAALGVTRRTLLNYRAKGLLTYTRIGGKIFYDIVCPNKVHQTATAVAVIHP